jgi:hypothetical protein
MHVDCSLLLLSLAAIRTVHVLWNFDLRHDLLHLVAKATLDAAEPGDPDCLPRASVKLKALPPKDHIHGT